MRRRSRGIIVPTLTAKNAVRMGHPARSVIHSDGECASDVRSYCGMSLIMKRRIRLVMLVGATCSLLGCQTKQPPVTAAVLAGNYTFVCEDPESRATDHNLNHLVLQSDGTYDLVEGGTTKALSEKKGFWRVEPGNPTRFFQPSARPGGPSHWIVAGNPPNVLLDGAGYPVEIKKNEVRLLIDLDTGVWWVKPR